MVEDLPAMSALPDTQLERAECLARAGRTRTALAAALAALTHQDRRILHLRFSCGCSVAQIAARLRIKPKPLYVRYRRLLATLRSHLESGGTSSAMSVMSLAE